MTLPKVLLIEDEESTWKALSRCLTKQASVVWTKKGKEAFQVLDKESIQMIFLSEFPEDIDGITLIKVLKKKHPAIPIIFIASYLTVEKTIQIFKNGARELIQLPLKKEEIQEIYQKISYLINNKAPQNTLPKCSVEKSEPVSPHKISTIRYIVNKIQNLQPKLQLPNLLHKIRLDIKRSFPIKKKFKRKIIHPLNDTSSKILTQKGEPNQKNLLKIYFLGKFQVYLEGVFIPDWSNKKARCLFSYLVLHHKHRIHRDVLMNIFWPHSTSESARNCLNVTLHHVRNLFHAIGLKEEIVQYQDERYFLNPEIELYADFEDFRKKWQQAQTMENQQGIAAALPYYENAKKMYTGDFLQDEPFEELWESEREYLREIYLVILDKISDCYSLDGKPDIAITICQEILRLDNCREDIHQRLMKCYYRIGKRDKALKQYQQCAQILHNEFDISPSTKTTLLYEKIKNNKIIFNQ